MSSDTKIGDIVVLKTETQQQAHYQMPDGASVFLCALSLDDYANAFLRQKFFELATEVVAERIRAAGSNVRFVQQGSSPPAEANLSTALPCWSCPHGVDVRDQLRSSAASDIRLSPSGLPVNCCRVTTVGAFGSGTRAPRRERGGVYS
jgi:hypothetical protein